MDTPLPRNKSLFDFVAEKAKAGATRGLEIHQDVGISALKGIVGVPQVAVGLADIPTGGAVGKFIEEQTPVKFKETQKILDSMYSDTQKEAFRKVEQAEGFWNTAQTAIENPSVIAQTAIESAPSMLAGGVAGRGVRAGAAYLPKAASRWLGISAAEGAGEAAVLQAAGRLDVAAAAIGEGLVGAGATAEQLREQSETGLLTPQQSLAAVASGIGTGALGALGGRVARRLGIEDIDVALAGGKSIDLTPKSAIRAGLEGIVAEGVLEEAPQSFQEQAWMNVATDRPIFEGASETAALGMVTGGAMGGGINIATNPARNRRIENEKIRQEVLAKIEQIKTEETAKQDLTVAQDMETGKLAVSVLNDAPTQQEVAVLEAAERAKVVANDTAAQLAIETDAVAATNEQVLAEQEKIDAQIAPLFHELAQAKGTTAVDEQNLAASIYESGAQDFNNFANSYIQQTGLGKQTALKVFSTIKKSLPAIQTQRAQQEVDYGISEINKLIHDRATKYVGISEENAPSFYVSQVEVKGRQAEAAKQLGKVFGKNVVFLQGMPENKHGVVITSAAPNTIFVSKDKAEYGAWIVGHETLHHLKVDSPELYGRLVEFAKTDITHFEKFAAQYPRMTDEDAMEELLGDALGDAFTDKTFWEQVYNEDRTLFEKILSFIQDVFARLNTSGDHFKDLKKMKSVMAEVAREYKQREPARSAERELAAAQEPALTEAQIPAGQEEITARWSESTKIASEGKIPAVEDVVNIDEAGNVTFKDPAAQAYYAKVAAQFGAEVKLVTDGTVSHYEPAEGKNPARMVIDVTKKTDMAKLISQKIFYESGISKENILAVRLTENENPAEKLAIFAAKRAELNNVSIERAEKEVLANMFSERITERAFYEELAKTEEGKKLARKILNGIVSGVNDFLRVSAIEKEGGWNFEQDVLLGSDAVQGFSPLLADITGVQGLLKSTDPQVYKTALENKQDWLVGIWRQLFPKQGQSWQQFTQAIEDLLKRFSDWLARSKPKWIYADLGADPAQKDLAYKVATAAEYAVAKANASVVEKHKDAFKGMDKAQLEKMHDDIVRAGLDFSKEEDVAKAKSLGYNDKIINAFKAYKAVTDDIYSRLKQIYPNLPKLESHYGQSIKWQKKNGVALDDDFDWAVYPEVSQLEGDKRFTKQMNLEDSTEDIAKRNNLTYRTIDPHQLFQEYVRDTEKLIALKEVLEEGQTTLGKNGKPIIKAFYSEFEANKEGYKRIADNATRVVEHLEAKRKDTPPVYLVTSRVKEEVFRFETKDEADAKAAELGGDYQVKVLREASNLLQMYFQEDLARMINILLAKDTLRNGSMFGISGQRVMDVKNRMTQAELLGPMFHVMTIANEASSSFAATEIKKGKFGLGAIPALNVGRAFKNARKSAALMEKILSDENYATNPAVIKEAEELFGTKDVDILDALKAYHRAGGFLHQDRDLRSMAHKKLGDISYVSMHDHYVIDGNKVEFVPGKARSFFYSKDKGILGPMRETYKEAVEKAIEGSGDKRLWAYTKTAGFAALEYTSAWLMEYLIPRVKMASFMREYTLRLQTEKSRLDEGLISKEEIARDTMAFIEDRFGEVNWKNMWMHPNVKTSLQFAFRSFTWFTGSWTALGKAGLDYVKWGWYNVVRGRLGSKDHYEITEKGWWGLSALTAHALTAGFVTALYSIGMGMSGGDEVPDEETGMIERVLFPRVDMDDPTARVTIPSYVSEGYKIARHMGWIGDEAEYSKLVTGRVNSLVSNAVEAYWTEEDWRGVSIVNPDDGFTTRQVKKIWHVAGVMPIVVSTVTKSYSEKGMYAFEPGPLILAGMGFTGAPAAAKRSEATNKAFELRREENPGKGISPDEMEEKEELRRAMYAYSQGDKSLINELLNEGRVSQRQFEKSLEKIPRISGRPNPRYKDQLAQAIKGLTIDSAIEVWGHMTDKEKKSHRIEILKKYTNMMKRKDKSQAQKDKTRKLMFESGILR